MERSPGDEKGMCIDFEINYYYWIVNMSLQV